MSDQPFLPGTSGDPYDVKGERPPGAPDGAELIPGKPFEYPAPEKPIEVPPGNSPLLPGIGERPFEYAHGERPLDGQAGKFLFSEEDLRRLTGEFSGPRSEWRTFYDRFMRSSQWREIADDACEGANWTCQGCGATGVPLHVHHLTYIRFGGRELRKDLKVLCQECHAKADDRRREAMRALRYSKWWRAGYVRFMERTCGEEWRKLDYADSLQSYRDCDACYEQWREERSLAGEED